MKNVYLVQANMTYGKSVYLPYAIGCLAAYAWQFEEINTNYLLKELLYRREEVNQVAQRLSDADVVAFSCYNWTFEYNKALAQELKRINPGCVIIFGGHNVSDNNNILNDYQYVDYLIYGEGEQSFKCLLDALAGKILFEAVPGIAYRNEKKVVKTQRAEYCNLDTYVSPYLEGYFDSILQENPDFEFSAVIETNRGCPYHCAYCDWGSGTKIREFPIERVKDDILWCARNHIDYVFCADANFGILKRDIDLAKYVVNVKKEYGHPYVFNACFAKNCNDAVFEIAKLFYDNKLNKAANIAFQSVNEQVLMNINRHNFSMRDFSELMKKYNEHHIPVYTEIILGLPGETYYSFCNGLCNLIEAGQQSTLSVYYCQVYPNALLGDNAYRERYGIKSVDVPMNAYHTTKPEQGDIVEYIKLVVGTKDLPHEDWIKCAKFCACLQCFHHIGLLKFFAIYLRKELNIPYINFYQSLLDFITSSGTKTHEVFERITGQFYETTDMEWTYFNDEFGEVGWFLEEGIYMELLCNFDEFWKDIIPFLEHFKIEKDIFTELIRFQRFVVRLPQQEEIKEVFEYDFLQFFDDTLLQDRAVLNRRKNLITVSIENPVYNWKDYAMKVMMFSKRKGGTLIINDRNNLKQTYLE